MNRDASATSANSTTKRTTLSELIMEFAEPLLALDASGASDTDVLMQIMVLVDMCWNLPILEETDPAAHARVKHGFDSVVQDLPEPMAVQLRQLLTDRKGRYGSVPFLVQTRVQADATGRPQVFAEARKPRA